MIDELATDRPAPKLKLRADSREIAAADPSDSATPILLEFESPTAAVLARPVPLRSRYMTWIVSSIFFVLLWLAYAVPIDRVVSTTGKVVATAPNIVVQPLETAIVRSIDVKDGDLVRKGQLLAQLDPTIAAADAGAAQAQVASLQAEVDRLTAESNNRVYLSDGTQPSELQAVIFAQRRVQLQARKLPAEDRLAAIQGRPGPGRYRLLHRAPGAGPHAGGQAAGAGASAGRQPAQHARRRR
jgi:HlyD family secretion protein